MDKEIIDQIFLLVEKYKESKDSATLKEIERLFLILSYQTQLLKYHLRLVENPNYNFGGSEIEKYERFFSHKNAFSKYHLIIPLLLFLFKYHKNRQPALVTSLGLMEESKGFLRAGDFAKTKTGVQRFITNTRFASNELRKYGLLRSDRKAFYHVWELSIFGILCAGYMYLRDYEFFRENALNRNTRSEVKKETDRFIMQYMARIRNSKEVEEIIEGILDDDVVPEYLNLFDTSFIKFKNMLIDAISDKFHKDRESTMRFNEFLYSVNSNKQISKLADAIMLKKDISVNMDVVYRLLFGGQKSLF